MGYFQLWRQNLAALFVLVFFAGLVALGLWLAHRHNVAEAKTVVKARYVTFVVTGSAPRGVAVTEEEAGIASALVARRAGLPFRARVSTGDGSPSYQFQAELLGAGRIRCTIQIGNVTEVRDASGMHATCNPAVSWGGSRFGIGAGWVPS